MTLKKHLLKFTVITFFCVIAFTNIAFAGGFPLRPGRLIISPSVSYFFSDSKWDTAGHKVAFPNNGQFSSYSFSLYAEYGISRRFSLVASVPYLVNTYSETNYLSVNSGIGDLETGIRYYIGNINFRSYFTIQATVISPLYTNLNLGYGLTGGEIKLSYGGGGHLFGCNSYYVIENAVRQYFGSSGPLQDRYNVSYGLSLDKKFRNQISVAFSGFYSTSNNKQFNILNPINNKDFAFNQVSLSYGHSFNKNLSFNLTGGHFITGRNTGDGLTASAALIYRIDYR